MAAAMAPDTEAEAPIIGAIACSWVTRGERAGHRRRREKPEEPDRAKAPRQRAAERQQPEHVEAEMRQIGVQQRIGDEGPDLGAGAARDLQVRAARNCSASG